MKKSIMRSIKPYWVYLILKGVKTIEIGKQKPKSIDWDGKVYIYCSKDRKSFNQIPEEDREWFKQYLGKVVAVFDCNCIAEDEFYMTRYLHSFYEKACLSHTQVKEYGQGKMLYGWHISNLKVFDIPKDLDEFYTQSCSYLKNKICCCSESCIYKEANFSGDISLCITPLERPPQSYCFVKEVA